MAQAINETCTSRQRGFKNSVTGAVVQVFGNDPAPVSMDGSTFDILWDHMVTTQTTVINTPPVSSAV